MAVNDDMWETARMMWENDPDITHRELQKYLQELFGEEAPKSSGTISKRAKKEGWKKKEAEGSSDRKQEAETGSSSEKNHDEPLDNKERQRFQVLPKQEAEQEAEEAISKKLVMTPEQKAGIILKHRRRLSELGKLQEKIVESVNNLDGYDLSDESDREEAKITSYFTREMANAFNQMSSGQKLIAEQEFAVCGITADDFTQSEQDRRLGALQALSGIEDKEREMRHKLKGELMDRLNFMEEAEHNPDVVSLIDEMDEDNK